MIIPQSPFSSGDFADHVDEKGRCVRDWRPGSGHRPMCEVREGPEDFDPPFGSGDVLVKVRGGEVPVYALSEEHYDWVRRQVFKLRLQIELDTL